MKFYNLYFYDNTLIELNKLFNKRDYRSIKNLIENDVINNKFMFNVEKERIINTYCLNVRIYFLFKKWIHFWKLKKIKFNYVNSSTLTELRPISEIPENEKFEIRDGVNIYTFDYYEIIRIIKNALENTDYMYPEPKYPFNPYNNKKFTKGQLVQIFSKIDNYLFETRKPLPTVLMLFKRNQFNITKFFFNCYNFLSKESIKSYVKDLCNESWYEIFEEFIEIYKLKDKFCPYCLLKIPNYRNEFNNVISEYLFETNSNSLMLRLIPKSYNLFKNLCEYYELKKSKSDVCKKHRVYFKRARGFKFVLNPNQLSSLNFMNRDIDLTNFKFTANQEFLNSNTDNVTTNLITQHKRRNISRRRRIKRNR